MVQPTQNIWITHYWWMVYVHVHIYTCLRKLISVSWYILLWFNLFSEQKITQMQARQTFMSTRVYCKNCISRQFYFYILIHMHIDKDIYCNHFLFVKWWVFYGRNYIFLSCISSIVGQNMGAYHSSMYPLHKNDGRLLWT